MELIRKIITFFDKLEDKIRLRLVHRPVFYAIIGGVAVVLFWKGVWETAEYFNFLYGPGSFILGSLILLITGLFVSFFIGDEFILRSLKGGKKLTERTEEELKTEEDLLKDIRHRLVEI